MKDAIITITTNDDDTIKYGKKHCIQYLIMESAKILKGELLLQDDGEKKSKEVELFMTIFDSQRQKIFGDSAYQIHKSCEEHLRVPAPSAREALGLKVQCSSHAGEKWREWWKRLDRNWKKIILLQYTVRTIGSN